MKSVLITFDQAYYERIIATLDRLNCRGFTYWEQVRGRGSKTGEPHYGSHAWPSMCSAILTMVEDERVEPLAGGPSQHGQADRAIGTPGICLEHRADCLKFLPHKQQSRLC